MLQTNLLSNHPPKKWQSEKKSFRKNQGTYSSEDSRTNKCAYNCKEKAGKREEAKDRHGKGGERCSTH